MKDVATRHDLPSSLTCHDSWLEVGVHSRGRLPAYRLLLANWGPSEKPFPGPSSPRTQTFMQAQNPLCPQALASRPHASYLLRFAIPRAYSSPPDQKSFPTAELTSLPPPPPLSTWLDLRLRPRWPRHETLDKGHWFSECALLRLSNELNTPNAFVVKFLYVFYKPVVKSSASVSITHVNSGTCLQLSGSSLICKMGMYRPHRFSCEN